jgi:hypothetical protein
LGTGFCRFIGNCRVYVIRYMVRIRDYRNVAINRIETCAACGADTDYRHNTPVADRKNYVIGVGQLCRACAAEIDREV